MCTLNWTGHDDSGLEVLAEILQAMGSVVVAYSGGTDSSFLAAVAHHVLGERALAVTGLSPSLPASERKDALRQAQRYGWAQRCIATPEFDNEKFTENSPDRCYHCKSELFRMLLRIAQDEGYAWVADGSNLDDIGDYRPGMRAKCELRIRSPLQEAGFDKARLRASARRIGLDTADKPASACLASRFPYGTRITPERLKSVERAEEILHQAGFTQVRVRWHGDVARIELPPAEIVHAAAPDMRAALAEGLKKAGFRYVALDLDGYRMGSLNEVLGNQAKNHDTYSDTVHRS